IDMQAVYLSIEVAFAGDPGFSQDQRRSEQIERTGCRADQYPVDVRAQGSLRVSHRDVRPLTRRELRMQSLTTPLAELCITCRVDQPVMCTETWIAETTEPGAIRRKGVDLHPGGDGMRGIPRRHSCQRRGRDISAGAIKVQRTAPDRAGRP